MDPIAPVASATASRLAALGNGAVAAGAGALTLGQVLQARVAAVDGSQVRLQLGEQLLQASSRVPLTVGQQVSLLVEQNASGKTLLRMIDGALGRGAQAGESRGARTVTSQGVTLANGRQGSIHGAVTPVPGRNGPGQPDGQAGSAGQRGAGRGAGGQSSPGFQGSGAGLPGAEPGATGAAGGLPGNGQPSIPLTTLPGRLAAGPQPTAFNPHQAEASPGTLPGASQRTGFTPGGLGSSGTSGFPGANVLGSRSPGGPFVSNGFTNPGGQQIGAPWTPGALGLPGLAGSAEVLTNLLFTPLDGQPAQGAPPPGPGVQRASGQSTADSSAPAQATSSQTAAPHHPGQNLLTDGVTGLIARAAMPTYGRLAQSVGGTVAFGQLLALHTPEISQTLARASLAPTDLGRLLVDVGVHPDEMNAVLVGELLAQGESVHEAGVRRLRREVAAAGGGLRDAAPAVALARLGLPITPLSLAVARQLQAGQLAPSAAWGELLTTLRELAQGPMSGSQAGVLAAELLADWRVPLEDGATGIARWLQRAIDQAGTPLEAKLGRPMAPPDGNGATSPGQTSPGQDVRARLDLLAQALPSNARGPRGELASSLTASLHRVQATVQGEQLLNGSPLIPIERADRSEPRFFAVTVPTVLGQQTSTLELRIKERDARPKAPGELGRPDVVHLKLSLPGLGDLGINLTVGQHSVACHFSTATPFAEALVTASSSELAGRLKRLGYGHTTVDATHEPPAPLGQTPSAMPRLHQVDLHA